MSPELILAVVVIAALVIRALFEVFYSGPGPLSR